MKTSLIILITTTATWLALGFKQNTLYKDGDIIFQTTEGKTGKAIQLATHSQYNHCGALFFENDQWMVYEAIEPVKRTTLKSFNERGKGIVKRLSNKTLSKEDIRKLKILFKTFEHKSYDVAFNWSDDQIYCSELVYKLYHNALQIELCKPRKLSNFDLNNALVKEKLNEKYGNRIPLNEPMVSPEDIFSSNILKLVK